MEKIRVILGISIALLMMITPSVLGQADEDLIAHVKPPLGNRGDIPLPYSLVDKDHGWVSVMVEYSVDGSPFKPCTPARDSEETDNREAYPFGAGHTFTWNSIADLGREKVEGIRIRITPYNGETSGTPGNTSRFIVNNSNIEQISGCVNTGRLADLLMCTGSASGLVAGWNITPMTQDPITFNLKPGGMVGKVLENPNEDEQDLVITETPGIFSAPGSTSYIPMETVTLYPGEFVDLPVIGYCINFDLDNPSEGQEVTIGNSSTKTNTSRVKALVDAIGDLTYPAGISTGKKNVLTQVAIWGGQDENKDVTADDFAEKGYPLNETERELLRGLYEMIGLDPEEIGVITNEKKEEGEDFKMEVYIKNPTGDIGDITIPFGLQHFDGEPISVIVQYRVNGGPLMPCTPARSSEGTEDLDASSMEVVHTFTWDSLHDLGRNNVSDVDIVITPYRGALIGQRHATERFIVYNGCIEPLFHYIDTDLIDETIFTTGYSSGLIARCNVRSLSEDSIVFDLDPSGLERMLLNNPYSNEQDLVITETPGIFTTPGEGGTEYIVKPVITLDPGEIIEIPFMGFSINYNLDIPTEGREVTVSNSSTKTNASRVKDLIEALENGTFPPGTTPEEKEKLTQVGIWGGQEENKEVTADDFTKKGYPTTESDRDWLENIYFAVLLETDEIGLITNDKKDVEEDDDEVVEDDTGTNIIDDPGLWRWVLVGIGVLLMISLLSLFLSLIRSLRKSKNKSNEEAEKEKPKDG